MKPSESDNEDETKHNDPPEAKETESQNETAEETPIFEQAACTNEDQTVPKKMPKNGTPSCSDINMAKETNMYASKCKFIPLPCTGAIPKTSQSTKKPRETESNSSPNHLHVSVFLSDHKSNRQDSESAGQFEHGRDHSKDDAEFKWSEDMQDLYEFASLPDESANIGLEVVVAAEGGEASEFNLETTFDDAYAASTAMEEYTEWLLSMGKEINIPVTELSKVDFQSASTSDQSLDCSGYADSEPTDLIEQEDCVDPDYLKEANKCMKKKSKSISRKRKNARDKSALIQMVRKNLDEWQTPDYQLAQDGSSSDERYRVLRTLRRHFNELRRIEANEERRLREINNALQSSLENLNRELQDSLETMRTERVRAPESNVLAGQLPCRIAENLSPAKERRVGGSAAVNSESVSSNEPARVCLGQRGNLTPRVVFSERTMRYIIRVFPSVKAKCILEVKRLTTLVFEITSSLELLFRQIHYNTMMSRNLPKMSHGCKRSLVLVEAYKLRQQSARLATHFNELVHMEMYLRARLRAVEVTHTHWARMQAFCQRQLNLRNVNVDAIVPESCNETPDSISSSVPCSNETSSSIPAFGLRCNETSNDISETTTSDNKTYYPNPKFHKSSTSEKPAHPYTGMSVDRPFTYDQEPMVSDSQSFVHNQESMVADSERLMDQESMVADSERLMDQESTVADSERLMDQESTVADSERLMDQESMVADSEPLMDQESMVADSEPLMDQESMVADSEPLMHKESMAADSEPLMHKESMAADSEPPFVHEQEPMISDDETCVRDQDSAVCNNETSANDSESEMPIDEPSVQ